MPPRREENQCDKSVENVKAAWIAGSSPAMTNMGRFGLRFNDKKSPAEIRGAFDLNIVMRIEAFRPWQTWQ
jgi:hypothetical protein